MEVFLFMAAAFTAGVAAVVDARTGQIPPWSTATIFVLGLAGGTLSRGFGGLASSLAGSTVLLFFFVALCAAFGLKLGGGDWKLAIAMGACIGAQNVAEFLPLLLFSVGAVPLAVLLYRNGTLNPVAQAKALWYRFRLERCGVAEPVRMAFGPVLAAPFVVYVILKMWGWW